jgi:cob(I)alamin adenosyltransferase
VTTGAGDGGLTFLADGTRVSKASPVIEALGALDELGSVLGVLDRFLKGRDRRLVREVQGDLCAAAADLAHSGRRRGPLLLSSRRADFLGREVARRVARLGPLKGFILPGGSPASAWCHLARAVARRAERRVAGLRGGDCAGCLRYLNRLSDLLFVMARRGRGERLWAPARGR